MNFMFDSQILRPYRKSLSGLAGYPLLFCPAEERRELCVDSATLAELDILLHAMAMESRQRSVGAELLLISHLLNLLVLVLRKSCSYVERERFNSDIGNCGCVHAPQLSGGDQPAQAGAAGQFVGEFVFPEVPRGDENLSDAMAAQSADSQGDGVPDPFRYEHRRNRGGDPAFPTRSIFRGNSAGRSVFPRKTTVLRRTAPAKSFTECRPWRKSATYDAAGTGTPPSEPQHWRSPDRTERGFSGRKQPGYPASRVRIFVGLQSEERMFSPETSQGRGMGRLTFLRRI